MTATIIQPSFQNDQKTLIDELLKSELFESLPIESIEEYLRSYENVFGRIALELLIEECLEKLKNREYKKLLELLSIFMNAKKESLAIEEKDLPPLNMEGFITPKTVGESLTIDELHELARCIEVRLAELVFSDEINLEEAQSLIENFYNLSPAEICMYTDEILEMLIENVHELKANELVGLIYSFQSKPIKLENSKTQTATTLLTSKPISLDQALSTEHEYTLGEYITHSKEIEKALQRLEDLGAITQDQAEQIFESLNRIPFASDEFKSKVLEVAIEVKYREVENNILPVLHQSVELTGRSNSAKHASSNIEKIVSSNAAHNSTSNEIKISAIPDGLKVVIEKAGVVLYKDAEGKPAGHAHVKEDGSLEYHPPGHECGPICQHDVSNIPVKIDINNTRSNLTRNQDQQVSKTPQQNQIANKSNPTHQHNASSEPLKVPDGLEVIIEKEGVVLYKDAEGKPAGHAHVKEDGSLEYHPPGHECGPLCAHDTPEPLTIQPIQLNS